MKAVQLNPDKESIVIGVDCLGCLTSSNILLKGVYIAGFIYFVRCPNCNKLLMITKIYKYEADKI